MSEEATSQHDVGDIRKPPISPFDSAKDLRASKSAKFDTDRELCYPFKRLMVLQNALGPGAETGNYHASFKGPRLNELAYDMIDSGRNGSTGNLSGMNSFSTSQGSSSTLDSMEIWSSSPHKPKKSNSRKRFSLGLRGKKEKGSSGWDLFPGITGGDFPASSEHDQMIESEGGHIKPYTAKIIPSIVSAPAQLQKAPAKLQRLFDPKPKRQKQAMNDLLAQTFDLQGAETEGSLPASTEIYDNENQCTVGGKALATVVPATNIDVDTFDANYMSSHTCERVKDTSTLHVLKSKGHVFVNEYAIITTLGRGSFGEVKLALNVLNLEVYALKLISKSRRRRRAESDDSPHVAEASVMSEINVMKKLCHPNLVRLVEVIDDPSNQKLLMVLEYVEGGSLFAGTKISPKKRLSELQARKYLRDVLQGIHYLHSHKIAHGDLKPDNFLLGTNGHIKIADFGSSQLTRVSDLVNRSAGTPAFMAPEMCSGNAYQASLADVWALGVCLYMFIYGTVPFKSESILGLYKEICEAPLEFPDDVFVGDSLKHLLTGLLQKDPEQRISLFQAMTHPWVTYNGELSLLGPATEESIAAQQNSEGYLMESWPDDPEDGILAMILRTMALDVSIETYPDGSYIARRGDPFVGIYKLEYGTVELEYFHDDAEGDSEDDEEATPLTSLPQMQRMRKLMLDASIKASELVTSRRLVENGRTKTKAERGDGCFLGEPFDDFAGKSDTWTTSLRAKGDVKIKPLKFARLAELIAVRPEVEADTRAVMAQRKGELLKMALLEKLAGLRIELQADYDSAQES